MQTPITAANPASNGTMEEEAEIRDVIVNDVDALQHAVCLASDLDGNSVPVSII